MTLRSIMMSAVIVASVPIANLNAIAASSLPAATLSSAGAGGGAPVSDGITPTNGGVAGNFTYGGEAGAGTTTTVIDFQLPSGVTVPSDPSCDYGFGELCLIMDTNCSPSTKNNDPVVLVSGNKVSFRLACDVGEGFAFEAAADSLLPFGAYDMSVQFKTTTLKRSPKGTTNMWQIKLPGTFFAGDL